MQQVWNDCSGAPLQKNIVKKENLDIEGGNSQNSFRVCDVRDEKKTADLLFIADFVAEFSIHFMLI